MENYNKAAVTAPVSMNWRTLLFFSAGADLVILLYMALFLRDNLALVLSMVILVGIGLLLFRSGVLGMLVLALVFADTSFWTLSGAVDNFLNAEAAIDLILPSFLGIISLAGLVAAVAAFLTRRTPGLGQRAARYAGMMSVALLLAVLAASSLVNHRQISARPAELVLETMNMKFSQTELTAQSGEITLRLNNHDLWWHTFTIKELGVELRVPMGAEREVTFQAPPGTYQYICGIPGHASIGMEGMLIVK